MNNFPIHLLISSLITLWSSHFIDYSSIHCESRRIWVNNVSYIRKFRLLELTRFVSWSDWSHLCRVSGENFHIFTIYIYCVRWLNDVRVGALWRNLTWCWVNQCRIIWSFLLSWYRLLVQSMVTWEFAPPLSSPFQHSKLSNFVYMSSSVFSAATTWHTMSVEFVIVPFHILNFYDMTATCQSHLRSRADVAFRFSFTRGKTSLRSQSKAFWQINIFSIVAKHPHARNGSRAAHQHI